jgi:hypothetical protein
MREAVKVLSVFVFVFAALVAAICWMDRAGGPVQQWLRYGCSALAVLAIVVFLRIHFRADLAPDYLHQHFRKYFNCSGLCFAFRTYVVERVCHLVVVYQNQQDQACLGSIALRPARGFFMGRADVEPIRIEIQCEPAAFGIAKIAIPVPGSLQGKRQMFEVGASVQYPNGKGRRLRFRDGLLLRTNADFRNAVGMALTLAGAVMGHIVWTKPANITIDLPLGVAEDVADGMAPGIKTLWKLGDPPLQPGAVSFSSAGHLFHGQSDAAARVC